MDARSWLRAGTLWVALIFSTLFTETATSAQHPDNASKEPVTATNAIVANAERLIETARKSVVVITVTGRDGRQQGLGSGFVVSADGLIATNLHVIGEARPIAVQMADGKKYDVKEVHA